MLQNQLETAEGLRKFDLGNKALCTKFGQLKMLSAMHKAFKQKCLFLLLFRAKSSKFRATFLGGCYKIVLDVCLL